MKMMTSTIPALLAFGVLVLLACSARGGNPAPAQPWRVMPLGDSITETEYRVYLQNALASDGYVHGQHFDMVGARNHYVENNQPLPAWDADHEGHGGFHTEQLLLGRWGQTKPKNTGIIKAKADGDWDSFGGAPDIVMLLTGTNDIGYDWGAKVKNKTNSVPEYAVHETIHDIRDVVQWLRQQNPNVKIALSTGIPCTQDRRNFAPGTVEALKDEIIKLVDGSYVVPDPAEIPIPDGYETTDNGLARVDPAMFVDGGIATADSPVILVDHWTGFDSATMLASDQIHPNQLGQELIGQRFATAVEPWLVPEPTSLGLLGLGAAAVLKPRRRRKDPSRRQAD